VKTIDCLGRDGVTRTFIYSVTKASLSEEWCYRVRSDPPPMSNEAFELTVSEISDAEVRVTAMFNYGESAYVAKGIPDALLPAIHEELGKIVSSSPTKGIGNVYRTSDAGKVWERLRASGIASYNESEDVYRIGDR